MEKNRSFMYSIAFLSLSIPVQGRFVYGFSIVLELFLLQAVGPLAEFLVKKLKFEAIRTYFTMMFLLATTMLYRQIMVIAYSEIALTLGLVFYFPLVSSFLIDSVFTENEKKLATHLKDNMFRTLQFSIILLLFYFFRDIMGFGTFTFFGSGHQIYEKIIFNPQRTGIFMFFASLPGALILMGTLIYLIIFIRNKVFAYAEFSELINKEKTDSSENAEEQKEGNK